ncbi:MMPL family transporter [Streptomyces phaeofaciens]|uniref:MMPL family transporter n=1 Tax=Streptomyces phaeofaciens TaxID=68254 RepID=UPI0036952B1A
MVSVFAGFVFNPEPVIKQAGFALATGILVDAFVIRMTLIPATMAIARAKAWWIPAGLNRLLPDLDVEGDKLAQRMPLPRPTAPDFANVPPGQGTSVSTPSESNWSTPLTGTDQSD